MIGLYDADLIDGGTRHPNLTLMKLSSYFKDHGSECKLIEDKEVYTDDYERILIAKVFSKTKLPNFSNDGNVVIGGTGLYMDNPRIPDVKFSKMRVQDMRLLTKLYPDYNPESQMPDYNLYNKFIQSKINSGYRESNYKDYKDFSIGFLTRGCIRHCPFCVNRNENKVTRYSHLKDFLDPKRKYIYLWDDNIMAAPPELFNECIDELISSGKHFQFKQGLDMRLMTDEKAEILTNCKYYGDYIFAFDNWEDRIWIDKKLELWRKHNSKSTKLYLFCGFKQDGDKDKFFEDILNIFRRIEILMRHKCLGYVMRHADYVNAPIPNIYVNIARWCNQPSFYKKESFIEFLYTTQKLVKTKECMALRTYKEFCEMYKDRISEIEPYFNMKYTDISK